MKCHKMVFDSLLNKLYELLLPQGSPGGRKVIEDRFGACKMSLFTVEKEAHSQGEWNQRDSKHKIQEVFRG